MIIIALIMSIQALIFYYIASKAQRVRFVTGVHTTLEWAGVIGMLLCALQAFLLSRGVY